jgi:hypothetical protein
MEIFRPYGLLSTRPDVPDRPTVLAHGDTFTGKDW